MPANRSRTEHWRDNLTKVLERGGSLELTIAPPPSSESASNGHADQQTKPATDQNTESHADDGHDVIWRVKLLQIRDDALLVEHPSAFGSTFKLRPGVELIGAMTIGQNRWMFHTRALTGLAGNTNALALSLPERVERCTRRSFFRISTANVRLPRVQCWPLLNPNSVGAAESANRALIESLITSGNGPIPDRADDTRPESILLPEVGPMFQARLLNMSGGGLGLMVDRADMQTATMKPFWWLRVDLRPEIAAPVAVTARLAHTHIDSTQALYCGMAFEFSHSESQSDFIINLFSRYTDELQRRQLRTAARAG